MLPFVAVSKLPTKRLDGSAFKLTVPCENNSFTFGYFQDIISVLTKSRQLQWRYLLMLWLSLSILYSMKRVRKGCRYTEIVHSCKRFYCASSFIPAWLFLSGQTNLNIERKLVTPLGKAKGFAITITWLFLILFFFWDCCWNKPGILFFLIINGITTKVILQPIIEK